jgi:hypothetical protein
MHCGCCPTSSGCCAGLQVIPACPAACVSASPCCWPYLLTPIDLIPDFIPVLGYADDAIIVAIALRSVTRHAGPEALDRHWPGTPAGLATLRQLAGLPTT